MTNLLKVIALLMLLLGFSMPAAAQRYTVGTIPTQNVGNVAAAASGTTSFRVSAANGTVTRLSGSGARMASGTARSLVTVRCNNNSGCNSYNVVITISMTGTPTNRAASLGNFTVSTSGATASLVTTPGTGSSISFQIGPIGRSNTRTFWVGYDFPIKGDDSGAGTGLSAAQFAVTAARSNGSGLGSGNGTVQAKVFRRLAIARTADMAFGTIVRPSSGSGSVSLDRLTGAVSVSGSGAQALASPSPSAAGFSITGEGGQSVSVTVPSSFIMTGPSGSLTVNTNASASGAQILNSALGSGGSLGLTVGGSFNLGSSTPTGAYTGVLTVTVQYN